MTKNRERNYELAMTALLEDFKSTICSGNDRRIEIKDVTRNHVDMKVMSVAVGLSSYAACHRTAIILAP